MTYIPFLAEALRSLRPVAKYSVTDVDGNQIIDYADSNDLPCPTTEELLAASAQIAADMPMRGLRRRRDQLLAETDWVVAKAVDASNDGLGIQLPQVWVQYRQALRDLPANTVDPANPVWPEKPQ